MTKESTRDPAGVRLAIAFLALGVAGSFLAWQFSAWWLILSIPFSALGVLGLGVELGKPRR
ncbi:MAG TPA: hypothetical protein VM754_00180 [Actinomycetota bacterium]|nr:hypothetical protein [Actinomycetota bacterium]